MCSIDRYYQEELIEPSKTEISSTTDSRELVFQQTFHGGKYWHIFIGNFFSVFALISKFLMVEHFWKVHSFRFFKPVWLLVYWSRYLQPFAVECENTDVNFYFHRIKNQKSLILKPVLTAFLRPTVIPAAKYEISRLFRLPKGNLFWPPQVPGCLGWFCACKRRFENVVYTGIWNNDCGFSTTKVLP